MRGSLIVCTTSADDQLDFARLQLALDFYRKGPAVHFRAIVEEWDQFRIVKETY